MIEMTYLEWLLIGLTCVFLELFLPGVYLIWFGFSAFVTAGIAFAFEWNLTYQLVLFAVLSAVFACIGWRVYARVIKTEPLPKEYRHLNDMAGTYIGKQFLLIEDVVDGRSKVKVGDTVWIAACREKLKKGQIVTVVSVSEGVILNVEKMDK